MNQVARWIVLVPAVFIASSLTFGLLTLLWNVVANLNIVPQSDVISLGLANFGINAVSAAAGVAAGAALLPLVKGRSATVAAGVSVAVAIGLLAWAFAGGSPLGMSIGWHAWSTVGWVVGAAAAAVGIQNQANGASARAT